MGSSEPVAYRARELNVELGGEARGMSLTALLAWVE
jgi:hypothetical protein